MDTNESSPRKNRELSNHKSIWDFLASIRLTIVLLILLALVSIIGTVIKQKASEAYYLERFSRETFEILKSLNFLDVYHSWWFNALIVFLCVNLLICSIKNFPRTWKIVTTTTKTLDSNRLKTLPYGTTITVQAPGAIVKERLTPLIRAFLGAPTETVQENGIHLFVEKARFSRLAGRFIRAG